MKADSFGLLPTRWHEFFCIGEEVCRVGDVEGDGRDDIITFVRDTKAEPERGDVYVASSDGSRFDDSDKWHDFFCTNGEVCEVGDFNGDDKDDVVAFVRNSQPGDTQGDVYVALSTTGDYLSPQLYLPFVNRS